MDLNPVAVMIGKALVEIPPKFAGNPTVNPDAQKARKEGGACGMARVPRVWPKMCGITDSGCGMRGGEMHRALVPTDIDKYQIGVCRADRR